ncbi:Stress-response A/B barrel domain-containing protein HS1 [Linum perenne]
MEEMKSVVVAKFKPEISPDEIDKYIKDFANLVNLIEPMKDFHWGTDARMFNMHQGFTHVFVSSFESAQGLREFLDHPAHVESKQRRKAKLQSLRRYEIWKIRSVRMEEGKGEVKHVLLTKFKPEISAEEIDKLIKDYSNLVNLIEPMKAFHWGTDVSIENMHQGFTHVFVSTFESTEGIAEYVSHPAHVEFANVFLAALDKVVVVDYKPTSV